MRTAGSMSWQIRENLDRHLATALYVRDAAGLRPFVVGEPDVGDLWPEVTVGADADAAAELSRAVSEWPQWWARALHGPPVGPSDAEPLPPGPPDWRGLEDLPAVRALAERHHRDAARWVDAARAEVQVGRLARGGRDPLHLTHFVNGFEQRLGRPVRPFALHLRLLPLAEPVGWVLDGQQVLVSTRLLLDPGAVERFLDPVVAALA
ncbi:hypothetical protein GTR02_19960 [Kineococcus sp. R8]|uniref:hypothetical protein n=1 Tax=Kineococcus siccus TaxID=2696567 RepID=UPI001412A9A6|nr:hypothetical protein [Kineococcus siccus]NAZ84086.1 hypothetical protein [Kineococcus siccus]